MGFHKKLIKFLGLYPEETVISSKGVNTSRAVTTIKEVEAKKRLEIPIKLVKNDDK